VSALVIEALISLLVTFFILSYKIAKRFFIATKLRKSLKSATRPLKELSSKASSLFLFFNFNLA